MKTEYAEFFDSWPWEWFVSLTFKNPSISSERASTMLKDWTREVAKGLHLQIAYFGVFNFLANPHLHLLMCGRNRYGQTLLMANKRKCERLWGAVAEIEDVYDNRGAADYLTENMPYGKHELFDYNLKLLKKLKVR